jgi:tetratricopeptide (TPR) repeat protein
MAVLLMAGDAGKEKVALALIDQNRRGEDEAVADRRARAFVRAFKVSQRRQSLRELEATLNLQILTPEDKYRLAKLYEAEKDWPKAQAQILSLLETSRRNPVYLAHYVGTLIQRGELEAARVWFARLERIEPSSPRANDLRARLKTPE